METISYETRWGTTYTFKVVDSAPDEEYRVWNIGDNMIDGYLPLARVNIGLSYNVDVDTLVAIDMSADPELLQDFRKAASVGVGSLKDARKYAKILPTTNLTKEQHDYAVKLLSAFEKLYDNGFGFNTEERSL